MLWLQHLNPAITSATQWFERTLDDSANKRLKCAGMHSLQLMEFLDLYLKCSRWFSCISIRLLKRDL